MHYRNGREAKNGDRVVVVTDEGKLVRIGILYDAVHGNNHCNGRLAPMSANDPYANLRECLHADDVAEVVSSSPPEPAASPAA